MGKHIIIFDAKYTHCRFFARYTKGKLTRHKCMKDFIKENWSNLDVINHNGKQVTLKTQACIHTKS